MKNRKRYLSFLLAMILLIPMTVPAESANLWKLLEQAQIEQDYLASTFWLSQWEGEINAFDRQDNPLDIEESMRIGSGTVLETAEESLAVVDMDRERLAIMDEISRSHLRTGTSVTGSPSPCRAAPCISGSAVLWKMRKALRSIWAISFWRSA